MRVPSRSRKAAHVLSRCADGRSSGSCSPRFRFSRSMYQGAFTRGDVGSARSPGRWARWCASSRRGRRGSRPRWSFAYSSSSSRANSASVKVSPAFTPVAASSSVKRRALVQPLPQDAHPDLAGGHVLHQVEHVVVAEEVGRLERRGLEALAEGVAVLEGHAQQIAGAAHGAGRRLELDEGRGVRGGVGRAAGSRGRAGWPRRPFPDRPHDVHHLPVRHPLAAGPGARSRSAAGHGARFMPAATPAAEPTGMLGSMPPCQSARATVAVGGVDGAAHAVLVGPHVAVGHGDGVDVGVDGSSGPTTRRPTRC
jgi:hypothetical protein